MIKQIFAILFVIAILLFPAVSSAHTGMVGPNDYGYDMMGWGMMSGFWFIIVWLGILVWLIVGILLIVFLWKKITRK